MVAFQFDSDIWQKFYYLKEINRVKLEFWKYVCNECICNYHMKQSDYDLYYSRKNYAINMDIHVCCV